MGSPCFRFKQFTVWHDRCAMKVGTDGVLLGAWCTLPARMGARVLDIGTGSGLIALMIAQRLEKFNPEIVAIDIDANAVEQSQINFQQSPWKNQLHSRLCALQDLHNDVAFDLIVSNPPYFQSSLKNPDNARATARHTDSLSYRELISHSARLLAEDGSLSLVLPAEGEQEIMALAKEYYLYPTHITHVYSKPGKSIKRILITFSKTDVAAPNTSEFYIESETSPRSEEYQALTKDFYL